MKRYIGGLLTALLLWGAYDYYYSRMYGRAAAVYLFDQTEIKGPNGQNLSRADLINLLIASAVDKAKEKKQGQ